MEDIGDLQLSGGFQGAGEAQCGLKLADISPSCPTFYQYRHPLEIGKFFLSPVMGLMTSDCRTALKPNYTF